MEVERGRLLERHRLGLVTREVQDHALPRQHALPRDHQHRGDAGVARLERIGHADAVEGHGLRGQRAWGRAGGAAIALAEAAAGVAEVAAGAASAAGLAGEDRQQPEVAVAPGDRKGARQEFAVTHVRLVSILTVGAAPARDARG